MPRIAAHIILALAFAAAFISIIAAAVLAQPAGAAEPPAVNGQVYRFISHRGIVSDGANPDGIRNYPGNTIEAFRQAAAADGIWGIETDVQRTADGRYVCLHGKKGGKKVFWEGMDVKKTPLAELRQAKSGKGYLLPTLEEYLGICRDSGKVAVIELKDSRINKTEEEAAEMDSSQQAEAEAFARDLAAAISDAGMLDSGKCMFISFSGYAVSLAKQAAHDAGAEIEGELICRTGSDEAGSKKRIDACIDLACEYGLDWISVSSSPALVGYARSRIDAGGPELRLCVGERKQANEAKAYAKTREYGLSAVSIEYIPSKYNAACRIMDALSG